ncbi:MAG: Ycf66 family protein [Aphanizomenon sp.]
MLDYFLALVVGFGSLAIYLSAFFFPEIHRRYDFIWSGIGLFYALILWIFAPRITGGLLLGHIASVSLLVWFVAQTLLLRRQLTPPGQQTPFPSPELIKISFQEQMSKFSVKEKFAQLSGFVASVFAAAKAKIQQVVNKKPAVKTAEEILQTTRTEATPPSKLPDEPVTATPTITSEISSGETFSQSLDVVEAAPTLPPVIDKQQIISPQEPEIVVEITQTQVIVAIKETGEEALPEQIPLNKPVED